jgi:hypothetical protein
MNHVFKYIPPPDVQRSAWDVQAVQEKSVLQQAAAVYSTTANSFARTKLLENARTTKIMWEVIFNLILCLKQGLLIHFVNITSSL